MGVIPPQLNDKWTRKYQYSQSYYGSQMKTWPLVGPEEETVVCDCVNPVMLAQTRVRSKISCRTVLYINYLLSYITYMYETTGHEQTRHIPTAYTSTSWPCQTLLGSCPPPALGSRKADMKTLSFFFPTSYPCHIRAQAAIKPRHHGRQSCLCLCPAPISFKPRTW